MFSCSALSCSSVLIVQLSEDPFFLVPPVFWSLVSLFLLVTVPVCKPPSYSHLFGLSPSLSSPFSSTLVSWFIRFCNFPSSFTLVSFSLSPRILRYIHPCLARSVSPFSSTLSFLFILSCNPLSHATSSLLVILFCNPPFASTLVSLVCLLLQSSFLIHPRLVRSVCLPLYHPVSFGLFSSAIHLSHPPFSLYFILFCNPLSHPPFVSFGGILFCNPLSHQPSSLLVCLLFDPPFSSTLVS